jgi:uncharacterized protein (DUF885 family)
MRLALCLALTALVVGSVPATAGGSRADAAFAKLAARFVDQYPAFSPVGATLLGDHRFDAQLDEVSAAQREKEDRFAHHMLDSLVKIDRAALSRPNQVDAALLDHELRSEIWQLETLREWEWNPLAYTGLTGNAIYGLMARDFAPLPARLTDVAARLEQIPRLLEQVRATLVPARVPRVHADTAVKQNRGVLSVIDEMVVPNLGEVDAATKARLERAIAGARAAVEAQQKWLEGTLVPNAAGDFRLGTTLFDQKLAFALDTPLTRAELSSRAKAEFDKVREQMYEVAKLVYGAQYPYTKFPAEPSEAFRQAVTRAALERAYAELPDANHIVDVAKGLLADATAFVKARNLVTVPPDPVEVVVMPEFQRGVAIAYCDSPGPLDVGQKTFYDVAPLPADWTPEQVHSFLREYNIYSLRDLTVHEAMPGHFVQLAHANRYPSTLRALLSSGTFVEGWAVYAEHFMVDAGFGGDSPLQRLIQLKWYLRAVANAILDQGIHCEGMTREQAMELMVEGAFQEEREAALKWTRAQLTSAQLSTYFVGYQELADLRQEVQRDWGDNFDLKRYHDTLLSFGSPPPRFVRALLLGLPIPK